MHLFDLSQIRFQRGFKSVKKKFSINEVVSEEEQEYKSKGAHNLKRLKTKAILRLYPRYILFIKIFK